jgi:hypothetical protein
MVEGQALTLEVGGQGGKMLGHVAVDVDDRVTEAAADLGGGGHGA